MPTTDALSQAIEQAKQKLAYNKMMGQAGFEQPEIPQPQWVSQTIPQSSLAAPATLAPTQTEAQPLPQAAPLKPTPIATPPVAEDIPFWQRSLEVFTAPFEWVDKYLIKPTYGVASTSLGLIPDVAREPGEGYFDWKRRSWASWNPAGMDVKLPWSEESLRLDVRGVLELAPWLLIPGAGQVGTATRAGVGIAGMLGKVGKVGETLGYAVQYSPWGIVEKVAGAAMKGVFKGIGKGESKLSEKVFGKVEEPPLPVAVQKINTIFKEQVVPQRKAFEEVLKPKKSAVGEMLRTLQQDFTEGRISRQEYESLVNKARTGATKPEFAITPPYQPAAGVLPESAISKAEMDELLGKLITKSEGGWVAADSYTAMKDLLLNGTLPEPHNLRDFALVYGKEFADTLRGLKSLSPTKMEHLWDILNIPRATLASGDLSGTFRQGLFLILTHPTRFPRSFYRQLKAFASEKITLEMDDALRSRPLYDTLAKDWNIDFTAVRKGAKALAKEEPFFSNAAQALPFVRRSERAFTTFLNEMRMAAGESAYASMVAQGATKEQMRLMGEFINLAAGRGKIPFSLDKYAPAFNSVLFSAKYQMATLQMPRQIGRMLLSKNPYMRKEAAKALITFVGGGTALVGLINAAGNKKVELDPRSGDFGKIVVGDTRFDIWRGYIQYIRFAAQLLTGERKSAYGNLSKDDRFNIAFRFLQGKFSPAAGLMADLLKGENYRGEPLFSDTTGFLKSARDRVLPLALQDIIDAMEQYGTNGLLVGIPAVTGIGSLTYVNDYVRVQQKIARDMGYNSWDDIDPATQKRIENSSAELQVAQIKLDRDIMGTAWGEWSAVGRVIEDNLRKDVEIAAVQYQDTGDGYQFRTRISDAFTARRGSYNTRMNDPRFAEIKARLQGGDTMESLISLGPEQMAIKAYNDALYGDDMYDQYGEYMFDEATRRKELLRQSLGDQMYDYVEDYQGIKYENFPPIYQELTQARAVLKPYWQIESDLRKLYGSFMDTSRGQTLLSRIRKNLRRSDPEIDKYLTMFYTRV